MRWNGQPGKRAEWSRTAEKDDGCDDARAEACYALEERGGYGRGARRAIRPVYYVGGHGREGAGHSGVEASGRRERMLGGERRWRRRVRRQVRGLCVLCHGVREDARIVGACGMELRAQNAGFKGSERHPHMVFPAIH